MRRKKFKNITRTTPTAAAKAAAQARNKQAIQLKKMYPESMRARVYDSKKVPRYGTPKPPTIAKGADGYKRVSAVVGDTRTHEYYRGKPTIKSVARTTQTQPIRRPATKAVRDLARQRALPTNQIARATQVRNNMRAFYRMQKPLKNPRGSIARARQAVPLTRAGKALQAANLSGMSHPAASRALARATAGVTIGGALLAYDAYKALDKYSKTSGPEKQMAKYKAKGGFSHMTSNPKKRGKQGLDY